MAFSYKELRHIEKKRRSLLRQCEDPILNILLEWRGTSLIIIATDPLLWISIGIYIFLRAYEYKFKELPPFLLGFVAGANINIAVIGAFVTYILSYYTKEGLRRFQRQYALSMKAKESLLRVASLARSHIPRERALRIVRYMNASYAAGFVGLSETYSYKNYFLEINKNIILLTDDELRRVTENEMDQGGSCYREIVQWVQIEIKDLMDIGILPKHVAKQFRTYILEFQSCLSQLYNYADQPIPFFYIHFIYLVSTLYLPLFSLFCINETILNYKNVKSGALYDFALDMGISFIILFQVTFVVGLRAIGRKLSDPFGSDYEDLSVMSHINYAWKDSSRIIEATDPIRLEHNSMTETEILHQRASVGDAWMESDKIPFINKNIDVQSTTSMSSN